MIDGQPEQSFLNWLCVGLKSFPHDSTLHRFVSQYCSQAETRDQAEDVLNLICLAVQPARRLILTEPLWDYLLKTDFATFERLWNDYLQPYRDHFPEQFVAYLSEWLIPAVWTASSGWIEEQILFLEDHADLLDNRFELTFEFYEVLKYYLKNSRDLTIENIRLAGFERFHQQLRCVCFARNREELQPYIEFQRSLISDFNNWAKRFHNYNQKRYQKHLAITWEWAAQHAHKYSNSKLPQLEQQLAVDCTRDWVKTLENHQTYSILIYISYVVLAGIIAICWIFLFGNYLEGAGMIFSLVCAFAPLLWLKYSVDKYFESHHYRKCVRKLASLFLRNHRPTFWQLHLAFDGWLNRSNPKVSEFQIKYGTFIVNDPALRIYRTALDFE
ncbi:hypothetical protein [uncultured Rubinisphaera sp.]|uniref:hypothetical protein n=1 Tax=uncultured Rubinisphaera sp. TaxID=1678686 RepID=UPI0030DB8B2B